LSNRLKTIIVARIVDSDLTIVTTLHILFPYLGGCTGFDGDVEAGVAGRGAAGLVKSGKNVIANNDYDSDFAYAYVA